MPAWSITSDRFTLAFPRPTAFCAANYDDPGASPPSRLRLRALSAVVADTFPCDDTCGAKQSRTRPDWGKFYASDAVRLPSPLLWLCRPPPDRFEDQVTRAFWGLYTDEAVQGPFVEYWEKVRPSSIRLWKVQG